MSRIKVSVLLLFVLSSAKLFAEENPPALTAAPTEIAPSSEIAPTPQKDVERIEVTGSHIKRIDTEGVSPVVTITRKEMDKTGYNSVADVVRDLSVNSFGSAREASGSNAAGVADVDLRGLGSSNTLVLMNGQRLPTDAVTGSVDLNLIPMAAVERIEILKDGASAIYGSDALGGVVNIITRKDFKGNEFSITQTLPELKGGAKTEMNIVNGFGGEKFNTVNVLSYRDNKVVYSKDRPWSDHNISKIGSPGSYSSIDGSGANGPSHADPNCPPSQIIHDAGGDYCSFNTSNYSTELPALKQYSLLSETNFELSSKVKVTARVGGTVRKVDWSYAPAPGDFTVPAGVASTLGPGGTPLPGTTPGQDLDVSYRTLTLGNRDSDVGTYAYNLLLGTQIELSSTWQLDVTGTHNMVDTKDNGVNGYALTSTLQNLIATGKFNPYAPAGTQASIDSARYSPLEHQTSQLSGLEMKASGELAKWDAGALGLAVGSTMFFERFSDAFDDQSVAGNVFGNAGSTGGGQRDTRSMYAEFSIPIFKSLELQLAGRYDHYSDFGDTVNPKAAFLLHVTPTVLFRGSVGTGFKAPRLQDLYASTSNGYPTFIDAVACKAAKASGGSLAACSPQQYLVTSGGNSGLKQETSLSYNAGVVWEPSSNFNISTDWFLNLLKNVVGIDYNDAMIAASKGANLANYGVIVTRNSAGLIQSIQAPLQNLSTQEESGIDLNVGYKIHRFKISTDHSQMFYFREEGFPGAGERNKLGENGRPAWRNTSAVAYTIDNQQEVSLAGLTTASQGKSVVGDGDLPTYTEFDAVYSYKALKAGTFSLGIKNLLGTTPPLDDSSPNSQLNTSIYDQIGRQLVAGYKVSF